ncbi:hypothetical protein RN001_007976 [Aquatica leii]|uniref:CRAL-TRIO domain-containing protein n=1 Tax=Aquatica leii TaxID=1421715 RepID=A0AAN7Q4R9_9COLE|nr:hypothetical protein RN001_007976 [Aquatica leii]
MAESEISDRSKSCKRCNKVPQTTVECIVCNSCFHPSCAKYTKNIIFIDDKYVNCCDLTSNNGELEQVRNTSEVDIYKIELKYLHELLKQKDLVIKNQQIAIESLQNQILMINEYSKISKIHNNVDKDKDVRTFNVRDKNVAVSQHAVNKQNSSKDNNVKTNKNMDNQSCSLNTDASSNRKNTYSSAVMANDNSATVYANVNKPLNQEKKINDTLKTSKTSNLIVYGKNDAAEILGIQKNSFFFLTRVQPKNEVDDVIKFLTKNNIFVVSCFKLDYKNWPSPYYKILMEKPTFEVACNIKDDLTHLREWIFQQPHLITRTDDEWIYIFLSGCKFNLEKTKTKIEKYYTLKTALPEFFGDRDPLHPNIQTVLNLGLILPLPKPSNSRARYFYYHCKFFDPKKIYSTDVIKMFLMVFDVIFMKHIETSGEKLYFLCDLDGLSLSHLTQATPSLCKRIITFIRNGFPGRPHGFYYLNTPSIFNYVLNIIKPLLGKKLSSRIKVYKSNDDRLFNDVPDVVLPKELGGKGKSVRELRTEWKQIVESYRDWFIKDRKYGCEESKRIGAFITDSELFGMDGSFKKLTID